MASSPNVWRIPFGFQLVPAGIMCLGLFTVKVSHPALLCPAGLDWTYSETKAKLQSGEIVVTGDQWPLFLYADYHYDPEDPWNGLLRSALLVCAYKYVFTSKQQRETAITTVQGSVSFCSSVRNSPFTSIFMRLIQIQTGHRTSTGDLRHSYVNFPSHIRV
ncbi:hypothetical protein CY34DRAFT_757803 [Suillus luteus UH-Slu-Lm8-n1]|uniref:Uncharacterized protein n=1 Tax=Suillus luteus UH-Slu-Lm8-n1 TaxID=930992 RepID=A0A0D0AL06_9AGAM|nr:hypothetical protein CY34DRAFT_757803 [Suillus luteus UH-Slu-Lm8-n1]